MEANLCPCQSPLGPRAVYACALLSKPSLSSATSHSLLLHVASYLLPYEGPRILPLKHAAPLSSHQEEEEDEGSRFTAAQPDSLPPVAAPTSSFAGRPAWRSACSCQGHKHDGSNNCNLPVVPSESSCPNRLTENNENNTIHRKRIRRALSIRCSSSAMTQDGEPVMSRSGWLAQSVLSESLTSVLVPSSQQQQQQEELRGGGGMGARAATARGVRMPLSRWYGPNWSSALESRPRYGRMGSRARVGNDKTTILMDKEEEEDVESRDGVWHASTVGVLPLLLRQGLDTSPPPAAFLGNAPIPLWDAQWLKGSGKVWPSGVFSLVRQRDEAPQFSTTTATTTSMTSSSLSFVVPSQVNSARDRLVEVLHHYAAVRIAVSGGEGSTAGRSGVSRPFSSRRGFWTDSMQRHAEELLVLVPQVMWCIGGDCDGDHNQPVESLRAGRAPRLGCLFAGRRRVRHDEGDQQQRQSDHGPPHDPPPRCDVSLIHESIRRGQLSLVTELVTTFLSWQLDGFRSPCGKSEWRRLNDFDPLQDCCSCFANLLCVQDHQGHTMLHAAFRCNVGPELCAVLSDALYSARHRLHQRWSHLFRLPLLVDDDHHGGRKHLLIRKENKTNLSRCVERTEQQLRQEAARFDTLVKSLRDTMLPARDLSGVTMMFYVGTRTVSSLSFDREERRTQDDCAATAVLPSSSLGLSWSAEGGTRQSVVGGTLQPLWRLLDELRPFTPPSATMNESNSNNIKKRDRDRSHDFHQRWLSSMLLDCYDVEDVRSLPVHTACRHGHVELLRYLLEWTKRHEPHRLGHLVNTADGKGATPLWLAASKGHHQVCELLLSFAPNLILKTNPAVLDIAVRQGHVATTEVLLRHGVVVSAEVYQRVTRCPSSASSTSQHNTPSSLDPLPSSSASSTLVAVLEQYLGAPEHLELEDVGGVVVNGDRGRGGGGDAPHAFRRMLQLWEVYRGVVIWTVLGYCASLPVMWLVSSM